MPASALFCQHVLKYGLIEAKVSNQPLQPQILLFQLPHMFELRRGNSAVLLAPRIKSGIRDTQLTADIRHGRPQLGLLESKDNLLFGESFFSSLKKERIRKRIYKTRDLARADIFDYIEVFYNPAQRHSHLGGVSPEAFEQASS